MTTFFFQIYPVNTAMLLTIFIKRFISDDWQGPESVFHGSGLKHSSTRQLCQSKQSLFIF